jgi:integrase
MSSIRAAGVPLSHVRLVSVNGMNYGTAMPVAVLRPEACPRTYPVLPAGRTPLFLPGIVVVREARATYGAGPRLLDRVRDAIRTRHCSRSTERTYCAWIRRFILFHGKHHPADMGAPEVGRFLSWLATEAKVSASTQNQALAAILFLYRVVLRIDLPWIDDIVHAKRLVRAAHLSKSASCHTLRHSFATHLLGGRL